MTIPIKVQSFQLFECRNCKEKVLASYFDGSGSLPDTVDYERFIPHDSPELAFPVKCKKCGRRMRNTTDPKLRVTRRIAELIISGAVKFGELEPG